MTYNADNIERLEDWLESHTVTLLHAIKDGAPAMTTVFGPSASGKADLSHMIFSLPTKTRFRLELASPTT